MIVIAHWKANPSMVMIVITHWKANPIHGYDSHYPMEGEHNPWL
jgi:hypothetical protein